MTKTREIIFSLVFIFIDTIMMSSLYIFGENQTFAYVAVSGEGSSIKINNINVDTDIETTRYDGPNIIDNDLDIDIDLYPYEEFKFTYDIVNTTSLDYKLTKVLINCLNNKDVNNYLSIDLFYEDGTQVKDYTDIPTNTKRTVYGYIKYDKNVEDLKTFKLNINMDFNPSTYKR